MKFLHSFINLSIVLGLFLLSGCGGDPVKPGTEEHQQVAAVIAGVNDAAGDEETFQSIFVSGSAPAEQSKYYSAKIEVVGQPQVSGDTATAQVKISQGASESEGRGGEPEATKVGSGEVTWTLKKEGDAWKIEKAPLP